MKAKKPFRSQPWEDLTLQLIAEFSSLMMWWLGTSQDLLSFGLSLSLFGPLLEVNLVTGETCVTLPIEADSTLSSHSTHDSTMEKYFPFGENRSKMFVENRALGWVLFWFWFDGNLRTPLVQFGWEGGHPKLGQGREKDWAFPMFKSTFSFHCPTFHCFQCAINL